MIIIQNFGCNIEAEFESRRIMEFGFYNKNKMHHKYCVIDLKQLLMVLIIDCGCELQQ